MEFTTTFRTCLTVFKEIDRLARIHENQRKSRARKQEYVRELEYLTVACDSAGNSTTGHRQSNRLAKNGSGVSSHQEHTSKVVSLGFSATLV